MRNISCALTEPQLQVAARKLCEIRGVVPDGQWTPKITNEEMAAIWIESFLRSRDNLQFVEAIAFAMKT